MSPASGIQAVALTIAGLDVIMSGGACLVASEDGEAWICHHAEWNDALDRLEAKPARLFAAMDVDRAQGECFVAERRGVLFGEVHGPVLSLAGAHRGSRDELVELLAKAVFEGLLDDRLFEAFCGALMTDATRPTTEPPR